MSVRELKGIYPPMTSAQLMNELDSALVRFIITRKESLNAFSEFVDDIFRFLTTYGKMGPCTRKDSTTILLKQFTEHGIMHIRYGVEGEGSIDIDKEILKYLNARLLETSKKYGFRQVDVDEGYINIEDRDNIGATGTIYDLKPENAGKDKNYIKSGYYAILLYMYDREDECTEYMFVRDVQPQTNTVQSNSLNTDIIH